MSVKRVLGEMTKFFSLMELALASRDRSAEDGWRELDLAYTLSVCVFDNDFVK